MPNPKSSVSFLSSWLSHQDLCVLSRPTRWSAVARGAVCRGLEFGQEGVVAVRLARKHWGTPASELYDSARHLLADRYVDGLTSDVRARGQMQWLIQKGDRLPENRPKRVTIDLFQHFGTTDQRVAIGVLAESADDEAPKRFDADGGSFLRAYAAY